MKSLFIQALIIFLISSIFFKTFLNAFFSRYFPPTATNTQNVSSTITFSVSVVKCSPKKLKFQIFFISWNVWVNGSKTVTSSCRVMLQTIYTMNNWFIIFELRIRISQYINQYCDFSPYLSILKLHVDAKVDKQTMLFFYIKAFLLPLNEVTEEFKSFFISHPI